MSFEKLKIKLANCYGIGNFEQSFNISGDKNSIMIYASNGIMKTSLTRTFKCIMDGKKPEDEIYSERKTNCSIKVGNPERDIKKEEIFVANMEELTDSSQSLTSFLASSELKQRYDNIYNELKDAQAILLKKLKDISHSSDLDQELRNCFKEKENDSFYDCLLLIEPKINCQSTSPYTFKYNDIFDKDGKVKIFVEKNKNDIINYFNRYTELLDKSTLFSSGESSFGTNQIADLEKAVDDDRYFKAKHTFVLRDKTKVVSKEQLNNLIDTEKGKLLNDEKLLKTFNKIDKALGKNKSLENFQDAIQNNSLLITELADYESFRKKVILSYVCQCKDEFQKFIELYKLKKEEIKNIINKANEESSKWKEIIDIYNSRFHVPFKVEIANKSDVILHENAASLNFIYKDSETSREQCESSKDLFKTLSNGEKRAFNILQIIFKIEALKSADNDTLLVFDDIADSFDYKNKYAIIEYLADIKKINKFTLLILTHNFDFYRSLANRAEIKNIYFAKKDSERVITLDTGAYIKDMFKNYLVRGAYCSVAKFISLIPFVRNIVEYTCGEESDDYILLTKCLHIKKGNDLIHLSDINKLYKKILSGFNDMTFSDNTVINAIKSEADKISRETDEETKLENKLILSIASRLKAEEYMLGKLNENAAAECNEDQTSFLRTKMIETYTRDESMIYALKILGEVLMMTSENIHLNNFMFEPLVDTSSLYLIDLYKRVKNLS